MDTTIQTITKSSQETAKMGEQLGAIAKGRGSQGTLLCLYGELGSGKTTFIQGFARGLGIPGRLLSPTYIIVRRYNLGQEVRYFYHIDLYRLISENELTGIGISEILNDPTSVIAIEWAEKLGQLLPKRRTDIRFESMEDGSHKIQMKKFT